MNASAETLDARWMQWLRTNIQISADFVALHRTLREAGYSDEAIANSVELIRPRHDAFESGVLSAPPLVRRHPPNLRRLDPKVEIYALDDFMDADECAEVIALSDQNLGPSPLAHYNVEKDFRTSRTCSLSHLSDPLVARLDDKIARTLGINPSYGEGIQAQRYDVGQQFKAHWDCFEPGSREYLRFAGIRGNRTWTFMVYLNDGMEGGATRFTEIDLAVPPKLGMALLWNNLHPDGSPDTATKHCGEPVIRGHKCIITKWFRIHGDGPVFTEEQP
jgi:prolyl 4-hydroxylase